MMTSSTNSSGSSSGSLTGGSTPLPFRPTPTPATLLWTKKVPGAVSGLSASWGEKSSTQFALVASSPDPDIVGSSERHLLTLFNSRGRIQWQKTMKAPVKEQDISSDGSMVVISNYSDELRAWDSRGNALWTVEGVCRPQIFRYSKRILCYHDDDADPKVAFEILDWSGNKLGYYPIVGDVLALKLAKDEKSVVIGLTGGQIAYFKLKEGGPTGTIAPEWQKTLGGEIVDVAVSPGDAPLIGVSLKTQKNGYQIALFDQNGNPQGLVSGSAIQIEFSKDGDNLYYYSNNKSGQAWGAYATIKGKLEAAWRHSVPNPSEYSSHLFVATDSLWLGFESDSNIDPELKRNHLLEFTSDGKLATDLMIPADEEAHLYTYRIVKNKLEENGGAGAFVGGAAVVATDDSKVSVFKLPAITPSN